MASAFLFLAKRTMCVSNRYLSTPRRFCHPETAVNRCRSLPINAHEIYNAQPIAPQPFVKPPTKKVSKLPSPKPTNSEPNVILSKAETVSPKPVVTTFSKFGAKSPTAHLRKPILPKAVDGNVVTTGEANIGSGSRKSQLTAFQKAQSVLFHRGDTVTTTVARRSLSNEPHDMYGDHDLYLFFRKF